jgi:hypothetical protein
VLGSGGITYLYVVWCGVVWCCVVWCGVLFLWVCPLAVLLPMWDVLRAVSWFTVHLVMSSCGVTVTSLSLCIFNCGLPSFDQSQEISGCGTWLFSPIVCCVVSLLFTYFRGEYVLWSGAVCPRA